MEYLSLLGCTTGFKLFPVYDAPTEQMLDEIRTNLDSFTSRYNISMEDYSSIKIGNLFFGATAMANTVKELPTRYDQVEEGMQIIISNKMGSMPALSLYMLTQMDNNNTHKFEKNGISLDGLSVAKDGAIKSLSEPHFSLGRIISKHCPDFGTKYDKNTHITAVHPVCTDGFFAIIRLAELTNSHIVITELPMKNEELSRFATRELLIENSTASSNGCHLIVTTKDVTGSVVDDLRRHNFEPTVIGYFSKKERPSVTTETDIHQYIASKSKLAKLMSMEQKEGKH
jgi:selenophosphate synthase